MKRISTRAGVSFNSEHLACMLASRGIMSHLSLPYAFGATIAAPHDETVARITTALAEQGFGIITRIDMAATLQQKLGVSVSPYVILGACNPALAHRALTMESGIGVLLPCNVVVHEGLNAQQTVVLMQDPVAMLSLAANDSIGPLAADIRQRLERVLAAVQPEEVDVEC